MNTNRDLDVAIDAVAARMVAVPGDPEMVVRIVGALPERSSRLGWLIPQFAALGAIAIAAVVWSTRERPAMPAVLPSTEIATVSPLRGVIAAREAGTPQEPGTGVSAEPVEPWNPGTLEPDFERSLPALETVGSLVVSDVTTRELPASPALELAPIGVADLPLTAETFAPAGTKEF